MNELKQTRTPEVIGAEIRMYVDAGRRVTLLCGIEIGRRLKEAKEMLNHGEWLPWLEQQTDISERQAQRYMKVFEEKGHRIRPGDEAGDAPVLPDSKDKEEVKTA